MKKIYDIVIIGGGINGAGIARDAALRGFSVALFEAQDFGSGTSSASSKLIHGGIRYLEQGHFKLVKQALRERDFLMSIARSIVRPLDFFMPDCPRLRSVFWIRLGLILYDFLFSSRWFKKSQRYKVSDGTALKPEYHQGFLYQDARVDDARLVLLNIKDAHRHGAFVANYHSVVEVKAIAEGFQLKVHDIKSDEMRELQTRLLINATGPAVNEVLKHLICIAPRQELTWLKGSHILVKGLPESPYAHVLQHHDRRIVFVIPWSHGLSLVGTTEKPYHGDLNAVSVDLDEKIYLLNCLKNFFNREFDLNHIQAEFAGVRPLLGAPKGNVSAQSREYKIELQRVGAHASPVLTIYGGKLTTYRALSAKVVDQAEQVLAVSPRECVTHRDLLPGSFRGDPALIFQQLQDQYAWLPEPCLRIWFERYGLLIHELLENCQSVQDLGVLLCPNIYEVEILYLIRSEWVKSSEDLVRRRTQWGFFNEIPLEVLDRYF